METIQQNKISIIKKSSSNYTLYIPDEVEYKIRMYCAMSPNLEWSGVLFTSKEGSFNSELKITCKDIFLMAHGSAIETNIKFDTPDLAAYLAENPELMNYDLCLIHSHHNMSTNPSGTDINTLKEEGRVHPNNFVSLIVNNKGEYNAFITRELTRKINYEYSESIEDSYTKESSEPIKSSGKKKDSYTEILIEYYPLNIIKSDNAQKIFNRGEEILLSNKAYTNRKVESGLLFPEYTGGYLKQNKEEPTVPQLFEGMITGIHPEECEGIIDDDTFAFAKEQTQDASYTIEEFFNANIEYYIEDTHYSIQYLEYHLDNLKPVILKEESKLLWHTFKKQFKVVISNV